MTEIYFSVKKNAINDRFWTKVKLIHYMSVIILTLEFGIIKHLTSHRILEISLVRYLIPTLHFSKTQDAPASAPNFSK